MELIYLVLLLCAVIALNWRFLGLHRLGRGGRLRAPLLGLGKPCHWKLDPTRKDGALKRYVCATCGVDAYTAKDQPPRKCLRSARPSSL